MVLITFYYDWIKNENSYCETEVNSIEEAQKELYEDFNYDDFAGWELRINGEIEHCGSHPHDKITTH